MKQTILKAAFLITILAAALALTFAAGAEVYSGECGDQGDNVTWTHNTGTGALVIEGAGAMSDNPWYGYSYKSSVKTVTIKSGVTSIGFEAFSNFTSLTSITIPDSVTFVDDWSFENCYSLKNVTFPDSVTSIGECLFNGCTSLGNIVIHKNVSKITAYEYAGCTNLTSITIPDYVTSIDHDAFNSCTSLTSATIPNSVTSIEWDAFYNCSSLTTVTISNSVTSIGEYAFDGCANHLTIYGFAGSYAQTYAQNNSIPFVALDSIYTFTEAGAAAGYTAETRNAPEKAYAILASFDLGGYDYDLPLNSFGVYFYNSESEEVGISCASVAALSQKDGRFYAVIYGIDSIDTNVVVKPFASVGRNMLFGETLTYRISDATQFSDGADTYFGTEEALVAYLAD